MSPLPQRFRKRPVVIEAIDYRDTKEGVAAVLRFTKEVTLRGGVQRRGSSIIIPTLEGDYEAKPGDWIIKGIAGEFYPCKPEIFHATYEPGDEESA